MLTHFRPEITLYVLFPAGNYFQIQRDGPGPGQALNRYRLACGIGVLTSLHILGNWQLG